MRTYFTITALIAIITILFGCKQPIGKNALVGNWDAIKLDGTPINTHGFTSIKMQITTDSVYITTQMKTFGDVTTVSKGSWELKGKVFTTTIGEGVKESNVTLKENMISFSPDPLLNQDAVSKSEYQRVR